MKTTNSDPRVICRHHHFWRTYPILERSYVIKVQENGKRNDSDCAAGQSETQNTISSQREGVDRNLGRSDMATQSDLQILTNVQWLER